MEQIEVRNDLELVRLSVSPFGFGVRKYNFALSRNWWIGEVGEVVAGITLSYNAGTRDVVIRIPNDGSSLAMRVANAMEYHTVTAQCHAVAYTARTTLRNLIAKLDDSGKLECSRLDSLNSLASAELCNVGWIAEVVDLVKPVAIELRDAMLAHREAQFMIMGDYNGYSILDDFTMKDETLSALVVKLRETIWDYVSVAR